MVLIIVLLCGNPIKAYQPEGSFTPLVFSDHRGFQTLRLSSSLTLPYNFDYFQFTNFQLNYDGLDFYSYYTEQNLFHKTFENIKTDLGFQYMGLSGNQNDSFRLGTRFRVHEFSYIKNFAEKINLQALTFKLLPYEFNDSNDYEFSMEYFYRIVPAPKLFRERVYIQGFLDHNLRLGSAPNAIITEHRIGIRTYKNLYTTTSLIYSNISDTNQIGVAFGLECSNSF